MTKSENEKPEENKMLVANGRTRAEKEPFFYDSVNGTILGRDCKAWAFWMGCFAIFLQTIDVKVPRFYGKGTIIGVNPGVGFQPVLASNPESTLIRFNTSDSESYVPYVRTLDEYLAKYSNINNTRTCTGSESNSDIVENGKVLSDEAEACRFSLEVFEKNGCSSSTKYGFAEGTPCIILSLNRLIGWKPQDFAPGEVPEEVKSRYKPGSIAFRCDGIGQSDKENIGKVEYLPELGINGRFYPFAVMANYHQPIAMAKFMDLPYNRVVMVECRAYAKNIEQDVPTRLGMVTFELFRVN